MKTTKKLKKSSEKMDTTTETRADNTVNYSQVVGEWPIAIFTTDEMRKPKKQEPIYKCDLFGDEWSIVHFVYDKKLVPSWFRRQCQRFFLGTKWTKL
jgi:hypothetical protein